MIFVHGIRETLLTVNMISIKSVFLSINSFLYFGMGGILCNRWIFKEYKKWHIDCCVLHGISQEEEY